MAREVGNLPTELTSFVGRRGELGEVKRLLAESRLVTLTGVGGVGKTRLALRAAAGPARTLRDGVWLVQLDQLRDPALVAQAVAGALGLGLQDRTGYAPAEALAGYLAGRQLLLVLDICEHLVDAGRQADRPAAARGARPADAGHQPRIAQHPGGDGAAAGALGRAGPGAAADAGAAGAVPGGQPVRRAGGAGGSGVRGDRGEHGGGGRDLPPAGGPAAGHRAGRGAAAGTVAGADR